MKAVILAGGLGTRLSEETHLKPKPMLEIGGIPLLVHIMRLYAYYGVNEFIICAGYKAHIIKNYFSSYFLNMSNVTFDFSSNSTEFHNSRAENWKVTILDTGLNTMTGGRLARAEPFLCEEQDFCVTYGDGLSNVDIGRLIEFHRAHKKIATLTSVLPPGRFGALEMKQDMVAAFNEKPQGDGARVNGGFFVFNKEIFGFFKGDATILERSPLESLAELQQLMAYEHNGFWHPVDTLRDLNTMQHLWENDLAEWKVS